MRLLLLAVPVLLAGPVSRTANAAADAATVERIEGTAVARKSDRVLYRERHWRYRDEGVPTHLVLYTCPEGQPFARKLLRETSGATDPDFDLTDGRDGHREGVRTSDDMRQVFVQETANAPLAHQPLPAQRDGVIDAGFDAFIRGRWAELSRGETAPLSFLVPSRSRYLGFRLSNVRDVQLDGLPAKQLTMGLASWYGFALPSVELSYDSESRRLLRYDGIGSIRDDQGRNLEVRISFPRQPSSATAAEVQQALSAPLSGRCAM